MKIIKNVMIFYDGGKRQRNPSSKSFIKTKQKNKKCTRHKKSREREQPTPKNKKKQKKLLNLMNKNLSSSSPQKILSFFFARPR